MMTIYPTVRQNRRVFDATRIDAPVNGSTANEITVNEITDNDGIVNPGKFDIGNRVYVIHNMPIGHLSAQLKRKQRR